MNILGISAFYHDSAACLVQDGRIIGACQEERFTRKKHDLSFPKNDINYCLYNPAGLASLRGAAINYFQSSPYYYATEAKIDNFGGGVRILDMATFAFHRSTFSYGWEPFNLWLVINSFSVSTNVGDWFDIGVNGNYYQQRSCNIQPHRRDTD